MSKAKKFPTLSFSATLEIIGINPYVSLPPAILKEIFQQSGRDKSPISVIGTVNGKGFQQSLVRYAGGWKLYINTNMLPNSPRKIGETIDIEIAFDPVGKQYSNHPGFMKELNKDPIALGVFNKLPPSHRDEIVRYIAGLKTDEAVSRNIKKSIEFLKGKGGFLGRTKK